MMPMQIDELRRRIAGEPDRLVEHAIHRCEWEELQDARGLVVGRRPAKQERTDETRVVRHAHILGSPAPKEVIDAWQERWPAYRLPADLLHLVEEANGIHLWADADEGRAHCGLAPIQEWQPARLAMYGPDAEPSLLPERYLAISYDADCASFVVLDVESGTYYLMDSCGPDEDVPIGSSVPELLDWLWQHRIAP